MNTLMKWLIIVSLTFIHTNPLQISNANSNNEDDFCAANALHLSKLKSDTSYSNQHIQFEKDLLIQMSGNSIGSFQRAAGPYVLPIVIHIVHNNGSENLTDNEVLQGVKNLNDAFSNIDYYDPNTGVDTKINFCLAKSDPNGNATNGINRIVSPFTNMDANNDDLTVKDLSRWDPLSYINIWLVKEIRRGASTGVAGYAYFPSAHGRDFDGIMMEARWFASSQGASGVQIHEMGHYLGLYHTFQGGCANNNCLTQGDRVCDTPPDQSTVRVPCNGNPNSCSSDVNLSDPNNPFTSDQIDMFWNYMDYGDFDCYSAFTAGQSERMCAAIEVTRSSLLSSTACEDPCLSPVTASFNIPSTTVAAGTNVNFINTSTNGNTYSWTMDGVEFSTAMNPSFTFNQLGEFTVTLSVIGGENCRGFVELEIEVICPILNSFEADNLFPNQGATVNFTNNSSGGTNFEWTVNTNIESTNQDFQYTFLNSGVYEVCLSVGDGFCVLENCERIVVFDDLAECQNTFFKVIGNQNSNERGYCLKPDSNGDLYLGGAANGESTITKIESNGNILWQKSFDLIVTDDEHITDIEITQDGNLLVTGYSINNNNAFLFKYNPTTSVVLWTQILGIGYRAFDIEKKVGTDNYLLSSYFQNSTDGNAMILEFEESNGNLVNPIINGYSFGQWELFNDIIYYQSSYFVGGRYTYAGGGTANMRPSFSKFDANGDELFSKMYMVPEGQTARLYSRDVTLHNNNFVHLIAGDINGNSVTNVPFYVMQTDDQGTPIWLKEIDIQQMNGPWGEEIIPANDGYLIFGYDRAGNQDLFLVKIDFDGNFMWGKGFGGPGEELTYFGTDSELFFNGEHIYMIGESSSFDNGNNKDMLLIKTDVDGNVSEDCEYQYSLTSIERNISNPYVDDITVERPPYTIPNSRPNLNSSDINLVDENLCNIPCVEICDNELDDDGDGLIDNYDPDCACVYYSCEFGLIDDCPDCVANALPADTWAVKELWTYSFPEFTGTTTFVVGDIDGDCVPDVVGLSRADDEIQVIDGATGLLKFSIPTYSTGAGTNGQIAIADVDRNGWGDIFILSGASNSPADRNKLIRYEFDGTGLTERFKSTFEIGPYNNYDVVSGSRYDMLSINLADINFDGIPEAIVGNQVFNAIDGAILAIGGPDNSIGSQLAWVSNQSLGRVGSFPVLADVLPDFYCNDCSGLELVAGNMIYSIGLRGGPNTSTMTVEVDMSNEFPDGMTSIADFDKDGHLDVLTTYGVASTAHRYGFAIWNPLTSTIFDQREFTNNGAIGPGRTSIANLDNQMDDLEFVIRSHPNLIVYKFDPLTTTVSELNRTTVNDPSRTSTTIFDLDQDGQNEIFYRDEDQFRILKGDDLQDLVFPIILCNSRTNVEYPIVADINGDGQTEILVMCDDQVKILANNVPGKFWAPSRKVWNQFSYFNVNINDDLTIPFQQQKHNLPGDQIEYNTFLKQNALPKSPVADAKITIQDFTCSQIGVEITLEICNEGDNLLSSITPITFYQKNPTNSNAVILDIQDVGVTIPTGSCEEIMYNINFTGNDSIFIVVNDDGSRVRPFSFDDFPITTFPECDYLNNMDGIYLERQNLSVNLGPDIEVCDNGVWVLDAGIGFQEYRWSDASLEQTITVWEPGVYWVEVVGDCGSLLRDTIEISIIPTTQIELPDDMIVCLGDSVELFVSNFNSYKWWSTSPLVCDTCNSIKLFPNQTDTIIVLVKNGDACYSTDSLIIELDSFITIEDQVTLCEGDTLLYYDQIITEEGKYEHILNAINACDTLDVLNVELLETSIIFDTVRICAGDTIQIFGELVWEERELQNTFTAISNGCDSIININVILQSFDVSPIINPSCTGQMGGSIILNLENGTPPFTILLNNSNIDDLEIQNLETGFYELAITDALGCSWEETLEIEEVEGPEIQLIDTIEIRLGEVGQMELLGTPNANYTYTWSPTTALSCMDCPEPEIIGLSNNTIYQVLVDGGNGCLDSALVYVFVDNERRIFFPNVFSPNGDNINDQFYPNGDETVAEIKLEVYDRWGNQVFLNNSFLPGDPSSGWDGTYKGKSMNSGVFVYQAIVHFIDGESLIYKGDITLIR